MKTPLDYLVESLQLKSLNDTSSNSDSSNSASTNVTSFEGAIVKTRNDRIYGGQVASQALMAASHTVDADRPAISVKCDFLRAGDPKQSVIYRVENVRDGRSFNTRRITAVQHQKGKERIIFTMSASFQLPDEGLSHQIDMAEFPKPSELAEPKDYWELIQDRLPEYAKEFLKAERPFEERHISFNDPTRPTKEPPYRAIWYKTTGVFDTDNKSLQKALFTYISDMPMLGTCSLPHGVSFLNPNFQSASLDHNIWFHQDFDVSEWMLFVCDSPITHGTRGFNRSTVYNESGKLIASVTQEGLIRFKS